MLLRHKEPRIWYLFVGFIQIQPGSQITNWYLRLNCLSVNTVC